MKKFFLCHENDISAAYIWIIGGSNLDKQNKKGINQILCSLLTRGCKSLDSYEISNILDFNGAEMNYETSQDGIYIGIKSLKEYFNNIYPLLTKMINESIISEKEFIKCKKHQINYLIKAKENLFVKAYNNWTEIVYKNHPYSNDSNGYINTINNINYDDIVKEYENFKQRDKYLLSNHEMKSLIDINFQKKIKRSLIIKNKNSLNKVSNKRYSEFNLSTNQIIIMMGNQTCSHNNKDYLSLKVLESYLSFGMSSLLFKKFREKNGLTYDIGVINPVRIDNAPFLIYLSLSPKHAQLAFKILISIWKDICTGLIPKKELDLAKTKLKNAILNSNQNTEDIILRKVQLIGYQMDHNFDFKSIGEFEEIDSEVINKIANKYFKKPYLSLLGESKICSEIKKIWIENF
tara:strand:+ start:13955 stop:15169 length:1215 start_codon:yes stop_codon:yes gene_type:complete